MTIKFRSASPASDMPPKYTPAKATDVTVRCTALPNNAALYSVLGPQTPPHALERASCDVVLVIDVSGSMGSAAPLPDLKDKNSESAGLSILDLVKHASRTILEGMTAGDRLALVTFSTEATVLFPNEFPIHVFSNNHRLSTT